MHKVLIAEDDKLFAKLLDKMLDTHGNVLDVITVSNGKIAMDVLEKHRIDLLVTDILMPEVDGFELLAHVSAHYPVIPCFVMTAIPAPEVKSKMPRDLVRFFHKPFDLEVFAAAVLRTVQRNIPRGGIHGISVASFCSLIEMEKKTCLFEVKPEGEKPGLFYFDHGNLFDASFSGLKGDAAAIRLLGYTKAAFKFRHFPDKKIRRRIDKKLRELIEQGLVSDTEFGEIDWGQVVDDDK